MENEFNILVNVVKSIITYDLLHADCKIVCERLGAIVELAKTAYFARIIDRSERDFIHEMIFSVKQFIKQ